MIENSNELKTTTNSTKYLKRFGIAENTLELPMSFKTQSNRT